MNLLNKNIGTFCEKCRQIICICVIDTTFEELIKTKSNNQTFSKETVLELMRDVRNATAKECSNMANEHGAFYTCDEIDFKIANTDYIKNYK